MGLATASAGGGGGGTLADAEALAALLPTIGWAVARGSDDCARFFAAAAAALTLEICLAYHLSSDLPENGQAAKPPHSQPALQMTLHLCEQKIEKDPTNWCLTIPDSIKC